MFFSPKCKTLVTKLIATFTLGGEKDIWELYIKGASINVSTLHNYEYSYSISLSWKNARSFLD